MTLEGPTLDPRDGAPTSAVILFHGYGANGNDLIELGHASQDMLPQTVFLAPDAPEELPFPGFGGRQWFPLTLRDPEEFWRGVNAIAPAVNSYLDEVLAHYRLPMSRVALVGFSQGCMLALHVGLRRGDSPAALVGYSGRLAGPEHLSTELAARPPILLIHGEIDDVSFDGRSGQLKVKDTVELPVAIAPDPAAPTLTAAKRSNYATGPPSIAGVSPPLHVLHCVYLK